MKITSAFKYTLFLMIVATMLFGGLYLYQYYNRTKILEKVVERLSASSRIAEAVVTEQVPDFKRGKLKTTIKFLEYDSENQPMEPQYFTFDDNIIQFQALVVRFDDYFIKNADPLKGKSLYLFLKAFSLSNDSLQVYPINEINQIPEGYQVSDSASSYEKQLWRDFWKYALDKNRATLKGIKNAQIEAPGTMFLPGYIYRLEIEHDGGIRIDVDPVPNILKI